MTAPDRASLGAMRVDIASVLTAEFGADAGNDLLSDFEVAVRARVAGEIVAEGERMLAGDECGGSRFAQGVRVAFAAAASVAVSGVAGERRASPVDLVHTCSPKDPGWASKRYCCPADKAERDAEEPAASPVPAEQPGVS